MSPFVLTSNTVVGASASTTYGVTAGPTSTGGVSGDGNTNNDGSGGGGYSTSDKIALGCGIGVGVPATLAAIATLWVACVKR